MNLENLNKIDIELIENKEMDDDAQITLFPCIEFNINIDDNIKLLANLKYEGDIKKCLSILIDNYVDNNIADDFYNGVKSEIQEQLKAKE